MQYLYNTLLGMGTVFVVLIFISIIISLFGVIHNILEKKEKKKQEAAKTVQTQPAAPAVPAAQPTAADDSELVAVIAAAIAASMTETTGQVVSADGLVIRSIKKRR